MKATDSYEHFITLILEQLYSNRQNHLDHKRKGISKMFYIMIEQTGHLADAFANHDYNRAMVEIAHVAAILFELYERVVGKNVDGAEGDEDGELDNADAESGGEEDWSFEESDSGVGEVGEAPGAGDGAGTEDFD